MRHVSRFMLWVVLFAMPVFSLQSDKPQAEAPGSADVAALMQKIRDLEDRIIVMEGQIRQLKNPQTADQSGTNPPSAASEVGALQPAATGSPASPTVALGGAGGCAAKALNPDISVIGNFIGVAGHNAVQPSPSLQMPESEVGLQAVIDPYARGDFFLSFGEEGVDLEEGYITFTSLPAGFVAKAGKMRSAFGKVNTLHSHGLPWVDRPLATSNLVGGEEGIGDVHPLGNPHYWLDPDNGRRIARGIANMLADLDPGNSAFFQQRFQDFDKRLSAAEQKWDADMKPWRGRKVVTYHRSFPNFAKHFGLDVIAYVEPRPGIPPTPSHTIEVIQLMKRENCKVVLVEPYFDLKTPQSIGRETGAQVVVYLPSVGGEKQATNYFELFNYDIGLLIKDFQANR
jgi:hypothetical protein